MTKQWLTYPPESRRLAAQWWRPWVRAGRGRPAWCRGTAPTWCSYGVAPAPDAVPGPAPSAGCAPGPRLAPPHPPPRRHPHSAITGERPMKEKLCSHFISIVLEVIKPKQRRSPEYMYFFEPQWASWDWTFQFLVRREHTKPCVTHNPLALHGAPGYHWHVSPIHKRFLGKPSQSRMCSGSQGRSFTLNTSPAQTQKGENVNKTRKEYLFHTG